MLQFAATNGTKIAQDRKLARSGLGALLDGVLISEEIGAEKPDPAFFAAAAPLLPNCAPDQILMVGDSLTSDMQLANNIGLAACWYNPKGLQPPAHPTPGSYHPGPTPSPGPLWSGGEQIK